MRLLFALSPTIFIGLAFCQPWIPTPRNEPWWLEKHELHKGLAEYYHEIVSVVFFGDSITQGWNNNEVWMREYNPLGSLNFGIGGDQIQNNLWRIINGEFAPLTSARLVVFMIGHNNIFIGNHSTDEIILGIETTIQALLSYHPNTKILLLSILPSGWIPWDRILDVNSKTPNLADGQNIFHLDMWDAFNATSPAYGQVDPELFFDGAHLTIKAYELWANTMRSTFDSIYIPWLNELKIQNEVNNINKI